MVDGGRPGGGAAIAPTAPAWLPATRPRLSWPPPANPGYRPLYRCRQAASANRTGTIPELLVKAIKTRGQGVFGSVDYIQRLDTYGGLAPSGSCTAGAITASQYLATENFWAPGASA